MMEFKVADVDSQGDDKAQGLPSQAELKQVQGSLMESGRGEGSVLHGHRNHSTGGTDCETAPTTPLAHGSHFRS